MLYFGLVSSLGRDRGRKPLEIPSESPSNSAQNCPLERDCLSVRPLSAAFGELPAAANGRRGGRGLGQASGWLAGAFRERKRVKWREREWEKHKKKKKQQQHLLLA